MQRLIEALDLPLVVAEHLDQSVQTEYRRLWELTRHVREGRRERG